MTKPTKKSGEQLTAELLGLPENKKKQQNNGPKSQKKLRGEALKKVRPAKAPKRKSPAKNASSQSVILTPARSKSSDWNKVK